MKNQTIKPVEGEKLWFWNLIESDNKEVKALNNFSDVKHREVQSQKDCSNSPSKNDD